MEIVLFIKWLPNLILLINEIYYNFLISHIILFFCKFNNSFSKYESYSQLFLEKFIRENLYFVYGILYKFSFSKK